MAAKRKSASAGDKKDFRALSLRLNVEAWKQLKHLATDQETSAHALILEGINLIFKKHGKRPLA